MKKLILLTAIILSGCSADSGCDCTKDTYQKDSQVGFTFTYLYSDPAICQDESDGWQGTGQSNIFFLIVCE